MHGFLVNKPVLRRRAYCTEPVASASVNKHVVVVTGKVYFSLSISSLWCPLFVSHLFKLWSLMSPIVPLCRQDCPIAVLPCTVVFVMSSLALCLVIQEVGTEMFCFQGSEQESWGIRGAIGFLSATNASHWLADDVACVFQPFWMSCPL